MLGDRATDLLAWYRDLFPSDPKAQFDALYGDARFRVPAHRLACAHAGHGSAPAYQYLFTWGVASGKFGACHSIEQPFVFDNLRVWELGRYGLVVGHHPPQELGRTMSGAWAALARAGRPAHAELPVWDPVGPDGAVMVFDTPTELAHHPDAERLALWDGLI
jgi:para-nitrobenzyl esterase